MDLLYNDCATKCEDQIKSFCLWQLMWENNLKVGREKYSQNLNEGAVVKSK